MRGNLFILSSLLLFASATSGLKILLFTPIDAYSHWIFMQNIIQALLNKNHEITVVTAKTWNGVKPTNYTEVLIDPPLDSEKAFSQSEVYEAELGSIPSILKRLSTMTMYGTLTAQHALSTSNVQRLLHDESLSFDLVINEELFTESFSLFAYKFKVPLYYLQFGLLTPWSHVPHMIVPYSDDMAFVERFSNAVISFVAFIRGAHIKEPQPLPRDIQIFLDGANDGAIYFSFGTYVKHSEIPPKQLQLIFDALRQVKQRVLWTFDGDRSKDIPSNVMIKQWMPQNDILAHKNVILFISHGGMFGQFESLYHGVPLIMIPFFGDQFRNAGRAQQAGYAKKINFKELSTNILVNTIHEMTTNKSYLNRAREVSGIFNANMIHLLDEAVYWIEYVAKFRGAKHLKSHAINMHWFSNLMFDVIGALLLGLLTAIFVIYFGIKIMFWRKKVSTQTAKVKQN
ncbi:UDP-glucuronosyltransferase 1-9-like [Contarinia nasturtii]|uniref:UDP-glucuronosyltransferase 1-9-like n=1 Tax=Contarinia nasturtii TaxID=265458 RepID=UPI0012D3D339|nr:UDP-glucuronosyltransferase 1-9-like [Contarinia nasturtii]